MTPEHQWELDALTKISRMHGCASFLEIGSRNGISLAILARSLPPGSRIVSVDLPGGPWGKGCDGSQLKRVVADLRQAGYDAHLFLGYSADQAIVDEVWSLRPFDLCYIDGDHTYEGVKADFENYGPMIEKVLAFDDIRTTTAKTFDKVSCKPGVDRLWGEIRGSHNWEELIAPKRKGGSAQGIGVIYR